MPDDNCTVPPSTPWQRRRRMPRLLPMLLVLAALHGGLYASLLPPWGLVDEEHHVDYIQQLVTHGRIPVLGQAYLSPEVVDSLFATRRWEVFHWGTPESRDPRTFGLEGYSYEGYQSPLFYFLALPLYLLAPGGILSKVFALRWAVVALSLVTVWITYRVTAELFPGQRGLPYAAALLLIVLPERTLATSRINNDVLLEVMAAAFVWTYVRIELRGLTVRRCQALGVLLGLGLLSKMSMAPLALLVPIAFWHQRRSPRWLARAAWTVGLAALLSGPLFARNLWLYGDLTGFAGFAQVTHLTWLRLSGSTLVAALSDLFRHFWVVWWQGDRVGTHPALKLLYVWLLAVTGLAALSLGRYMWAERRQRPWAPQTRIIVACLAVIAVYAVSAITVYFSGIERVIQGRLLLPAIVPIVVVFSWALWRSGVLGRAALGVTALGLVAIDALALFSNLLPYFYYWSAFLDTASPRLALPPDGRAAWALFWNRLQMDKPAGWLPVMVTLPVVYGLWLLLTGWLAFRTRLGATHEPA